MLVVAGFAGGVQADKHWGAKPSTDPADLIRQLAAGRTGGQGGTGGLGAIGGLGAAPGQSGARGTGGGTSGTVKLIDGDIIYVQTPNGIVRVKTTGSTKVTLAKKATVKSLKAGTTVTVQGTPAQDGTVTATSVRGG